jgi:aryl-alcohol dehydrogenase
MGTEVPIDVNGVMIPAKRIIGIVQGDVIAHTFIPTLIEFYRQGKFPFDRLIKHYDFEDSETGKTIKPVLRIANP